MSIKIGILLPRSDMFPTLALDFLNGFRMGQSVRGGSVEEPKLLIESIGNATGDSVLKTAEKMILQENVDLTVTFCSSSNLKELVHVFTAYKKNLIHIDFGGNVITAEQVSPYVIHHTLNLWQSAYKSGEYAAKNIGKNAAIAASFYDGGYHLLESFARGFTANGGNVVHSYVAPFDYKSATYQALIDGIRNSNPDFVFSLFSYKEEQKVLDTLSQKLENKDLPFIWSPLINLDPEVTAGYNLKNVLTLSSWDFESDASDMQNFQHAYNEQYNASPNLVGLMGYETGLTVGHLLDENGALPAEVGTNSADLTTQSPRGELSFNSFHETRVNSHLLRKYDFTSQPYTHTIVEKTTLSNDELLYDQFKDLPASGWKNPYIIT